MKKGFTLIELLAVIVILSVISVITVPVVNNLIRNANQQAYNENIEVIKKAAYDWTILNPRLLPDNDNESIVIYLGELKLNGNVDRNIKNPLTGKFFSNNTSVVVTKNGNEYTFEVNPIDLEGNSINNNAPLLVIEGNIIDYVEVTQENVTYTVPGASAKSSDGNSISSSYISYQIFKDDLEVSEVDISTLGLYTIKYSVTYNGETGVYEKKVIVRDTTKPALDVGENIICAIDSLPTNEDLLTGVTVTDNSGEAITPAIRSEVKNEEGTYYVYYDAADSSGNSITKRKEVIVNDPNSLVNHTTALGTNWTFDYNGTNGTDGSVQTFTVPETGTYKLEVWGAQGGYAQSIVYDGGKGGYAVGETQLNKDTVLYVVVGGHGVASADKGNSTGGYNGGGNGHGSTYGSDYNFNGSGGGATHIATVTGQLKDLSSNKTAVLIVAGGGGGGMYQNYNNDNNYGYFAGGAGGGTTGKPGVGVSCKNAGWNCDITPTGGTQENGGQGLETFNSTTYIDSYQGMFGLGASYTSSTTKGAGGGGGGYYGGATGGWNPGAGGSSYIGTLENSSTIAGDSSMPSHDGTTTMTGNSDHGYAKITLISY